MSFCEPEELRETGGVDLRLYNVYLDVGHSFVGWYQSSTFGRSQERRRWLGLRVRAGYWFRSWPLEGHIFQWLRLCRYTDLGTSVVVP